MKNKFLERVKTELLPNYDWLEKYAANYERTLIELERFCLPGRKDILNEYRKRYEQLFKLVRIGCEPATPPRGWHVGVLRRSDYGYGRTEVANNLEPFGLVPQDKKYPSSYGDMVFIGYTPPEVYKKYKEATRVVHRDQLIVVSPDPSLFQAPLVSSDPMLFVYVGIDDITWLRVCCWDISKDLEYIVNEIKPATG